MVDKKAEGHKGRKAELLDKGVRIIEVTTINGLIVWDELWIALTTPVDDFFGITSILVEGGARTWEVFRSSGFVDEEIILVG